MKWKKTSQLDATATADRNPPARIVRQPADRFGHVMWISTYQSGDGGIL